MMGLTHVYTFDKLCYLFQGFKKGKIVEVFIIVFCVYLIIIPGAYI